MGFCWAFAVGLVWANFDGANPVTVLPTSSSRIVRPSAPLQIETRNGLIAAIASMQQEPVAWRP